MTDNVAHGEHVEFGEGSSGYLARPAEGSGPGVVVIQEWWGLARTSRTSPTGSRPRGLSLSRPTSTTAR